MQSGRDLERKINFLSTKIKMNKKVRKLITMVLDQDIVVRWLLISDFLKISMLDRLLQRLLAVHGWSA